MSQIGLFWLFLVLFGSKPVSDGPLGPKGPSETGSEPKNQKKQKKASEPLSTAPDGPAIGAAIRGTPRRHLLGTRRFGKA